MKKKIGKRLWDLFNKYGYHVERKYLLGMGNEAMVFSSPRFTKYAIRVGHSNFNSNIPSLVDHNYKYMVPIYAHYSPTEFNSVTVMKRLDPLPPDVYDTFAEITDSIMLNYGESFLNYIDGFTDADGSMDYQCMYPVVQNTFKELGDRMKIVEPLFHDLRMAYNEFGDIMNDVYEKNVMWDPDDNIYKIIDP